MRVACDMPIAMLRWSHSCIAGGDARQAIIDSAMGGKLELSKKDRVLFINQYEILKVLDADNADHYEELIEILTNGYAIFFSKLDEWVFDEMDVSQGRLVLDTLDMYRAVANHFRENPGSPSAQHDWATFRGFDGNEETEYMSFACFLIEKQGKFDEQRENEMYSVSSLPSKPRKVAQSCCADGLPGFSLKWLATARYMSSVSRTSRPCETSISSKTHSSSFEKKIAYPFVRISMSSS